MAYFVGVIAKSWVRLGLGKGMFKVHITAGEGFSIQITITV